MPSAKWDDYLCDGIHLQPSAYDMLVSAPACLHVWPLCGPTHKLWHHATSALVDDSCSLIMLSLLPLLLLLPTRMLCTTPPSQDATPMGPQPLVLCQLALPQ
jgi:hypothetical protein